MKITTETVRERIASLESVGEMSIKERFYLDALRMLLASLEAEPVADVVAWSSPNEERTCDVRLRRHDIKPGMLYTAPPAPVSVPDAMDLLTCHLDGVTETYAEGWNACRAAMLQGAEQHSIPEHMELIQRHELALLKDMQRTLLDYRADSVWYWQGDEDDQPELLSCPVIMSAGTLRELLGKAESQKPSLTVWYGSMPETNGKANWTAILHRKSEGIQDGMTIDRSEYPGRVLYAADRVRYLIGEKADRPCILDYDADAHSGYVKPGNCPAIPDDVRRMDWLVSKTVDVREPMVYGSHSLFWSQTITDEEDDYHATKLREQIDAAIAAENAAAPQQEVK